MEDFKVNILGVEWELIFKNEEEDKKLENRDGYCDHTSRKIVIDNWEKTDYTLENIEKHINDTVRHEMVHVFLNESGLMHCSWAKNEEMVDWIALQMPKMIKSMNGYL